MPFLTQGKTNVKYLLIVIILAIFAGGLMVVISKMTECSCWWPSNQHQQVLPTDETANWQTYRNEEYGFEVKYPADSTIKNNYLDTLVWFEFARGGFMYFLAIDVDERPVEEYEKIFTEGIILKREISVNDYKGKEIQISQEEAGDNIYILLPHNSKTYILILMTWKENDEINNQMLSTFRFIGEDKTGITTYEKVKCQEIKNIECDRSFTDDYIIKYIKDLHSGGNYTEQEYKIVTFENQDSIIRGSVQTYGCSCCGGTIGSEANCEISEQYFNIPPDNSIVKVKFTIECSGDGKKTLEGQMGYNNELIDIEPVGPILASDIWGDESLYNCY